MWVEELLAMCDRKTHKLCKLARDLGLEETCRRQ